MKKFLRRNRIVLPLLFLILGIYCAEWIKIGLITFISVFTFTILLSLRITFCKYLLFIPLGLFLASGNPTDILLTGNVINKKVTIEGTLFRQPQRRANTTRLFLKIDKIETGKKTISADIKATITVQNKIYGMYEGQRIVIASIKLKRFTNYKNPGAFDIHKYYQRKGVFI